MHAQTQKSAVRIHPATSDQVTIPQLLCSFGRALTAREVAGILNIHVITLYRLAKKHIIPSKLIGGTRRFDGGAIAQWWTSARAGPSA